MSMKKLAFAALRTDLQSPETEAIFGYSPTVGKVTEAYFDEVWHLLQGESQPEGVGYVLLDAGVTFGIPVAMGWEEKVKNLAPVDRIVQLCVFMRRKYKNHPEWVTHKHRFMNRVTRVKSRALKMRKAESVAA